MSDQSQSASRPASRPSANGRGGRPKSQPVHKAFGVEFLPTEWQMVSVLRDGLRHTDAELHACLYDDLGPISNIWAHLSLIRKKLRPKGYDILREFWHYRKWYRLVKLVKQED